MKSDADRNHARSRARDAIVDAEQALGLAYKALVQDDDRLALRHAERARASSKRARDWLRSNLEAGGTPTGARAV